MSKNNEEKNVNQEIIKYKKYNNRNNVILIVELAILLFVCAIAVYVRCFG